MVEKPPIGAACNGCGLCCRIEVCAIGSFTQGLVSEYGARAAGPCPALIEKDDGTTSCGMVARPRDYSPARRGGAHDLRAAVATLIGAGIGCDEGGDEPDAEAKLRVVQTRFLETVGPDRIQRALETWFGL